MRAFRLLTGMRWALFVSICLHGLSIAAVVVVDNEGWLAPARNNYVDKSVAVTVVVNSPYLPMSRKLVNVKSTFGSLTLLGETSAKLISKVLPPLLAANLPYDGRLSRISSGIELTPLKSATDVMPIRGFLPSLRGELKKPLSTSIHRDVIGKALIANVKGPLLAFDPVRFEHSISHVVDGSSLRRVTAAMRSSRDLSVAHITHFEADLGDNRGHSRLERETSDLADATDVTSERRIFETEGSVLEGVHSTALKKDHGPENTDTPGPKNALMALYDPPPKYPELAYWQRLEGRTVIEVRVLESGVVGRLMLRSSSGHRILDKAALDAIRLWRFSPPLREGQPAQVSVRVPVYFRLDDEPL